MSFESGIIGLCVLAIIVLQPPLFWHTHTRNVPAVILILWLLVMNIISIVNAAIWSGSDFMNAWDGKVWCDIAIKLDMGASIGIPCAITDIVYNLHTILRATSVIENWNSSRRMIKDLLICLLSPAIVMAISYVLQVFRYSILRYNGCQNALSSTWLSLVLYQLWILLWAIFAAFYSLLVLFVFYKKRKDVKDILYCTNSGLNLTRFARLLILCFVIILIMLPLSIYGLVQNAQQMQGHYNFKDTHSSALWNVIIKADLGKPLYTVWIYVLASYLVFLVFGLGSDALSMYVKFLRIIKLGFIVDRIGSYYQKNRETKVGQLLSTMSTGPSFHSGFSQTGNERYGFQKNPERMHSTRVYVDYDMPVSDEKRFYGRFNRGVPDIESNYMEHEIDIDDSGYSPYLDDEVSKEEHLLLRNLHLGEDSSSMEDYDIDNETGSTIGESILKELDDLSSEEIRRDILENPFKTPTSLESENRDSDL